MIDKILTALFLLLDIMLCILLCCYFQNKYITITTDCAAKCAVLLVTSLPCLFALFCIQIGRTDKNKPDTIITKKS